MFVLDFLADSSPQFYITAAIAVFLSVIAH